MARVAFVLAEDFEDAEFRVPYDRIAAAGHEVTVVGKEAGTTVTGKRGRESFTVEATPEATDPSSFDALVIPGGYSPDKLRTDSAVVDFVRKLAHGGTIAAICHAGSLLIEADLVDGMRVTSWPSIRTDLENAGASWVDEEVVVDGNLVTSRKPDDLDAFCAAILERL